MTSRLVVLFLGLISFLFGFYLLSYKKSFDPTNPLSINSIPNVENNEHQGGDHSDGQKQGIAAQSSSQVELGKKVYTEKGQCVVCHGEKGEGNPDTQAPLLAGQHSWYTFSQLNEIKKGNRKVEAMQPFLEPLTDEELQALSKYVEELKTK